MADCIFCKIAEGVIPCMKVYETDSILAFLDIGPVSEGHTLAIPRAHYSRLDQCPPEVLADLSRVAGKLAGAVQAAMQAEGYNILCNNGRAAGQLVEHVHFHIIPRKTGDGIFNQWPVKKYPAGRAEEIAAEIIKKL